MPFTSHEKQQAAIKPLMEMREGMTAEDKRKLLIGLKQYKASVAKENSMTLSPQEPMWISEEQPNAERNVVAKTFTQQGNFDPFVNQNRGIQFAPKEMEALANFKKIVAPTTIDPFSARFETTDDFGNNTTTVIKKHRQGNQFVFTAFAKHDSSRPEPEPEPEPAPKQGMPPTSPKGMPAPKGAPAKGGATQSTGAKPSMPSMPSLKELATGQSPTDNQITITKTITFTDEIKGADILADFLRTLDL
jgi:hypothetical protein